jgi:hypothetical protein
VLRRELERLPGWDEIEDAQEPAREGEGGLNIRRKKRKTWW